MKNYKLYLMNLYEQFYQFGMKLCPYEITFFTKHFILFSKKLNLRFLSDFHFFCMYSSSD